MYKKVSGWSCAEISFEFSEINPFFEQLKDITPTNPIVNRVMEKFHDSTIHARQN
jgi:hypothetical protein